MWSAVLALVATACGGTDGGGPGNASGPGDPGDEAALDEPEVDSVASALVNPQHIGTAPRQLGQVSYDSTNAYFTFPATANCVRTALVSKMNLTSGAQATLSSGNCTTPKSSSSNGTTLYYLDRSANDVRRVAVAGGADTKFVDTGSFSFPDSGIFAGANYVIWGDTNGLYIGNGVNQKSQLVPRNDSAGIDFLGSDGSYWYYQDCYPWGCDVTRSLWRASLLEPPKLLRTQAAPSGSDMTRYDFRPFAFDSTHVYWASRVDSVQQNRVWKLQKSDSTIGSVQTTPSEIWSIAANSTHVYWSENQNPSQSDSVWRLKKSTNAISLQVSPASAVGNLYLTSTHLYWTESYALQLWRAELP